MNTLLTALSDLLRQNWVLLLVLGLLAAAWLLLRTPADNLSLEAFQAEVRSGQPVVVEVFSNT